MAAAATAPMYVEWAPGGGPEPAYRCTLHAAPCAWRGCRRRGVLRPLCAAHARRALGVELRPTVHGCGLFAARSFRKHQLIAPYLGRTFRGDLGERFVAGRTIDMACPRAHRRAGYHRGASPYAVQVGPRTAVDATCERSWASMANHGGDAAARNAELRPLRVRRAGFAVAAGALRAGGAVRAGRHYAARALLGGRVRTAACGFDRPAVWLCATRAIAPGDEILIDYRPDGGGDAAARYLRRTVHATVPSLCGAGAAAV